MRLVLLFLISAIAVALAHRNQIPKIPRFAGAAPFSVPQYRSGILTTKLVDHATGFELPAAYQGPGIPVKFAADPANNRYALIWANGYQYTTMNGSLNGNFDPTSNSVVCLYQPETTQAHQVQEYANRIRKCDDDEEDDRRGPKDKRGRGHDDDDDVETNEYCGMSLGEAGVAGDGHMAIRIVTDAITGDLLEWDFSQTAPHPRLPDGSCSPAQFDVIGQVVLDKLISRVPPPSVFVTPAACANAASRPTYRQSACF
jgi:hypothetical protein